MPEGAPLPAANALAASSRAQLFDRALGAYLGLAIGDALGATVEFMTPREIRHQYGVHRDMVGGGWLRLKPGQVTDDTTMSLALGEALLQGQQQGRPFDVGLMAEAFVRWWRGKPVDCGNTCRRGIMRYLADGSVQGPPQPGDGGNGALMRNLPVALATLGAPECLEPVSIAQAHITHHHPLSDAATVAFGQMLHALLRHKEPQQALTTCKAIADHLVERFPKFRYQPYPGRATGYVVDTVQTVLHHFLRRPASRPRWWARSTRAGTRTPPGRSPGCSRAPCAAPRPCRGAGWASSSAARAWPSPSRPARCWRWRSRRKKARKQKHGKQKHKRPLARPFVQDCWSSARHYMPMPPMPPMSGMPPPAIGASSLGVSATMHSVVSIRPATEAAFCSAVRVTLVGSRIPISIMSP